MRVDQLVPAFHRGDAIGDEAWELRRFFRAEGRDSEIYCPALRIVPPPVRLGRDHPPLRPALAAFGRPGRRALAQGPHLP